MGRGPLNPKAYTLNPKQGFVGSHAIAWVQYAPKQEATARAEVPVVGTARTTMLLTRFRV